LHWASFTVDTKQRSMRASRPSRDRKTVLPLPPLAAPKEIKPRAAAAQIDSEATESDGDEPAQGSKARPKQAKSDNKTAIPAKTAKPVASQPTAVKGLFT
jgi:hypothetical protein